MNINKEIVNYIEKNVFPSYEKNDAGHGINHIKYVINRSLKFAENVKDINFDMVYVIASYHDIGHYIDAKNHEKVSAQILLNEKWLEKYFTKDEINVMSQAVEDHRASLEYEPRSIYGNIVSSADRNTSLELPLKRTYTYRLKHSPNSTLDEIIEESRLHLIDKFGDEGYANEKMYFVDEEYDNFLKEIQELCSDKELFRKKYIEINEIK